MAADAVKLLNQLSPAELIQVADGVTVEALLGLVPRGQQRLNALQGLTSAPAISKGKVRENKGYDNKGFEKGEGKGGKGSKNGKAPMPIPPPLDQPEVDSSSKMLMTVHQKERAEEMKISRMIVDFAVCTSADVLVMGSTGCKETRSHCFQQTTLGSSAHLAALEAPCSVVLIRPGCRVDSKLATVFMVAVDGSVHSQYALQLCTEWARPDKDEIVCRVFGPAEFTEPVERMCTDQLQAVMRDKKVEYAVIPTELDDSADVHGDDLADAAKQCRFRQQAFLVFGARGRHSETGGFSWLSFPPRLALLLRARMDPLTRTRDGKQRCALHFAAKQGHCQCAQLLFEHKAEADCQDTNAETALQLAAYGGHLAMTQLLLSSGARAHSVDRDHWSPLICAARAGHEDIVKLLLSHKARVDAADALGRTALRHANLAGHNMPDLKEAEEESE